MSIMTEYYKAPFCSAKSYLSERATLLAGTKKTLWNGYPERSYIKCFCDKGMLSAATNNSIIIVVCSEQTPIIQI